LKQTDGKDIVCTGSIRLTHTLVSAGLVDEYRLFVYPTVQGRGRRLFPDGYEASGLRLLESRAFRSGISLQRYAAS
jgi:dihydrofolate reductase